MKTLLRTFVLPAGLVAMSLAGCQAAPTAPAATGPAPLIDARMSGDGALFVRPTVAGSGYGVASALTASAMYTAADIHHVTLALYVVTNPGLPGEVEAAVRDASSQPVAKEVLKADLGQPIGFTGLKRNTTYRVKATAYKAAGSAAGDVISSAGAGSHVTITVGTNDAPTMETLKVQLLGGLAISMKRLGENTQVGNPNHSVNRANVDRPAIASNGAGECLLVWQDGRVGTPDYDIYAQRMDVNGSPVGASIAIGTMTGVQSVPVVAWNGATGYMVAWQDARNGGNDIYAQRVNADGTLAGANFVVSNAANNQTTPAITWAAAASEFMVTWADGRTNNTNTDIYAQRVQADGTFTGGNFAVSTGALVQSAPAVAFDEGTGQYVFTWQDTRNTATTLSDIWARRMATDGTFAAEFAVCASGGNQFFPRIAYSQADNGNECLIVWQDSRISGTNMEVYGARLAPDGTLPAGEVLIASGTRNQAVPQVVWNGAGYMVAWQDNRITSGSPDIYVKPVAADGSPGGESVVTNHTETQFTPTLAWNGTRHVVAWQDNRTRQGTDIWSDTVNAGGTPSGALVNVGDVPDLALSERPAIAHNTAANTYMVVWQDNRNVSNDIYGQIMNADGTPAGGDFAVCGASGAQSFPTIAYNPTANNFLVAWQDTRNGSSNTDIYGALVGPTGAHQGEVHIAGASLLQQYPSVAFNPTAQEYLVAWQDNRNGNQDVYAAKVSASGVAGAAFGVTTAAADQMLPSVAFNGHADVNAWLVAWEDRRNVNYDVYANRVAADGTPAGEYMVAGGAGDQRTPSVAGNAATQEFLVAYMANGGDVHARRTGPANDLPAVATVVSNAANFQSNPRAVWNPTAEEYVVVWDDSRNSHYDVYGRRLLADGTGIATDFFIGQFLGNQQHPAIAFNLTDNQLLATWSDYRNGYGDIYTQRLDSYGVN
jgi:hypothetical protein